MKLSIKIKSSISLLVIVGILIMPFSNIFPIRKAEAQSKSISGYLSGIAPAAVQLPGCRAALGSLVFKLGGGMSSLEDVVKFTPPPVSENEIYDDAGNLITEVTEKTVGSESVPVNDENAQQKIDAANSKLERLLSLSTKISGDTGAMNTNQNCLNAIGKMVIKMLIQKITLSTVNWIQSGFQGNPSFVQNPGKFFGDIAKNEILSFGLEINDPNKYPFALEFMRNVALGFNNKFAQNAEYSLDKMIAETSPDCRDRDGNPTPCDKAFMADFSMGGWGAWEAMTQVPANNPLGFQLMASNELGARLEGTSQSAAQDIRDALQQASGFLGDLRCTDPWDVTKEEDDAAIRAGITLEQGAGTTSIIWSGNGTSKNADGTLNTIKSGGQYVRRCQKWEYVTPGSVISHQLTKSMDKNENSLLDAETLNDAVAAILDALLAKFSSELTNKGLALMDTNIDNYDQFNYKEFGTYSDTQTNNIESTFSPQQISSSAWLQAHPSFDIHTDITQALVDEQRTYLSKLASYNETLDQLITNTYMLDYCIPGPHPGWEQDSKNVLDAVLDVIPSETWETIKKKTMKEVASAAPAIGVAAGAAIGAACGSAVPGLGTTIGAAVGTLAAIIITVIDNNNNDKKLHAFYAGQIGLLTGIHVGYDKEDKKDPLVANLESKEAMIHVMYSIFDRYVEIINNVFRPEYLPEVAQEAVKDFEKIPGYRQIIKNNEGEIAFRKDVTGRLEKIKEGIVSGSISQSELDNPLSDTVTEFARISQYFATGSDIAKIDNIYKEALDESNHIYFDLLKGPKGCENDKGHFPWWQIDDTQRMTYYPLIERGYSPYPRGTGGYGGTKAGAGPGFLGSVRFGGTGGDHQNDLDRLDVTDLIPLESWATFAGKAGCTDKSCGGIFEKIIGIY